MKALSVLFLATLISGIVFAVSFAVGLLLYLFESASEVFVITYVLSIPISYIIHKYLGA